VNAKTYWMTAGLVFLAFGLQAQEEEAADTSRELIDAVREGEARDVTRLLTAGADAKTVTDGGMPLVALAAMKGHTAVADALDFDRLARVKEWASPSEDEG